MPVSSPGFDSQTPSSGSHCSRFNHWAKYDSTDRLLEESLGRIMLRIGRECAAGALEEKRSQLGDLLGLLSDFVPECRVLLVQRQVAFDIRAVVEGVIQDTLDPCGECAIEHVPRFRWGWKNALFRPAKGLQVGDGDNAQVFDFRHPGFQQLASLSARALSPRLRMPFTCTARSET